MRRYRVPAHDRLPERTTDPDYLAYQYGDSEKLRVRIDTHERYSERRADWHELAPSWMNLAPGSLVLDLGCGFGGFQPALCRAGARIVGVDLSLGMLAEARTQAAQLNLPVRLIHADAQAIPLADRLCDAVLAVQMLYYAQDIRRALEEMRRVFRPGGRVLITTNAADHSAALHDLHYLAARELGFTPTTRSGFERFTLSDLPLVRSVFPAAELHHLPNALRFPSTNEALRFYASGRIDAIDDRRADGSHRPPLLARVRTLIDQIISRDGAFRVSKNAGYFLATIDS
jgi:ubiquinone/menaquinone biosynthesis C-methylase UbiE